MAAYVPRQSTSSLREIKPATPWCSMSSRAIEHRLSDLIAAAARHISPSLLIALALALSFSEALADACDDLKAEIAALTQTVAENGRLLDGCTQHPGTCSFGVAAGYDDLIKRDKAQIELDTAQLPLVCNPPPRPRVDHVKLDGIEVVQSVQDLGNSVGLVAGKTTWVRVYLGKLSCIGTLTGTLRVQHGGNTLDISPTAQFIGQPANVVVNSADDIGVRRNVWYKSLNFLLPASMTSAGTTILQIHDLRASSGNIICPGCGPPPKIICDSCNTPTQVSFADVPPLRIRAVGLSYPFRSSPPVPFVTVAPNPIDFTLLQSWLSRAYPVSQANLNFGQTITPSTSTPGVTANPSSGSFTCANANSQLASFRASEISSGTDQRTHYIGLVSNQGFYLRGCAPTSGDTLVASAPSGSPTGPGVKPQNVAGDVDLSFADWYGGHELAHTFGRQHPGFCFNNATSGAVDPLFPYPNGQISDGSATSFVGLDVGDSANGIPLAVLPGAKTFDLMTYCPQPNWPSAYTFDGIRMKLAAENPARKRSTPTAAGEQRVHVAGLLNLTKNTAQIDYVMPVTRAVPAHTRPSDAQLVVRDARGRVLSQQPVALVEMADIPEGEDRTALIDATVPFNSKMVRIEFVLKGAVLAEYTSRQNSAPPTVRGLKRLQTEYSDKLVWEPADGSAASAAGTTYIVQTSRDGREWMTVAVGLKEPSLEVSSELGDESYFRITATNGFRSSEPRLFRLGDLK